MKVLLILATLMAAPNASPAPRQLPRALELRAEMERAEEDGKLELATTRAADALAAAEREGNLPDSELALFMIDLARLYSNGAERQKAKPLLERSLLLLERSGSPDHPRTA